MCVVQLKISFHVVEFDTFLRDEEGKLSSILHAKPVCVRHAAGGEETFYTIKC